jgi:hypothetical protein
MNAFSRGPRTGVRIVRMPSERIDARQIDLSGCELDEHECVQPPKQHGVDGEEVASDDSAGLGPQKLLHVSDDRRGAGSMPACCKIDQTVLAAIRIPSPASSPWIRR